MLAGDIASAVKIYYWLEKEFPDDSGEPISDLYWAIAEYRGGNMEKACMLKLILVAFLLTIGVAKSEDSSVNLDARSYTPLNELESNSAFYIYFMATTDSFPGHAFIYWIEVNAFENMTRAIGYGQHPKLEKKGDVRVLFGEVDGEIKEESIFRKSNYSFSVRVDYDKYQNSKNLTYKWLLKGRYRLINEDCVSFATDIAREFNLKVPERKVGSLTPKGFIVNFIKLNGKHG